MILLILVILILYLYTTKTHSYWQKRNVKHDPPLPLFGNHLPNFLVRRTVPEMSVELYNKYSKEKVVGYYRGPTPELIIRDPEIAKHILDLDFMHFYSRGGRENPKRLQYNLLFIDGVPWHLLREMTSSAFSEKNLRAMFPLVVECTEKLCERTRSLVACGKDIDANALMARYAIDFVSSCGLGVELGTLSSKYTSLIELTSQFVNKSKWQAFLIAFEELYPELKWLQRTKKLETENANTILDKTRTVRQERRSMVKCRNDFVDILLEIEATGKMRIESPFKKNPDGSRVEVEFEMDLEIAASQAFAFLLGGYESSTTVTSFTLNQLAFYPDIQEKIQQEIDTVLLKHHHNLCYDAVGEMTYLSMALKESMRMLPPIGFIRRKCVNKYTIPGTGVTIDPGVRVLIPNQALQMDPKYFENPEEFQPERFTPEAVKKRHSYCYLPFGEGPRKCPAIRLAEMQSLAGLAALLQRYTVVPTTSSKQHHHAKKTSQLMQVLDGTLSIRLVPRQNVSC